MFFNADKEIRIKYNDILFVQLLLKKKLFIPENIVLIIFS